MTLPNLISDPDTVDMGITKLRRIQSNSRDRLLARNQNVSVNVDCTAGGTIVLTVAQREPVQLIRLTGTPGAGFTVEFADGNRQFEIENVSGQTATIDSVTGAASPPVVADGTTAFIQLRGIEFTISGIVGLDSGALLHSGDVSPTAAINFADNVITGAELKDVSSTVTSPASSSGTLVLNLENGNVFDVTLTEAVTTLTINNPPDKLGGIRLEDGGGNLLLEDGSGILLQESTNQVGLLILVVRQDSTGGWAITWPASFKWGQNTTSKLLLEDSFGSVLLLETGDALLLESFKDDGQTLDPDAVDMYIFKTYDAGVTWYAAIAGLDIK